MYQKIKLRYSPTFTRFGITYRLSQNAPDTAFWNANVEDTDIPCSKEPDYAGFSTLKGYDIEENPCLWIQTWVYNPKWNPSPANSCVGLNNEPRTILGQDYMVSLEP